MNKKPTKQSSSHLIIARGALLSTENLAETNRPVSKLLPFLRSAVSLTDIGPVRRDDDGVRASSAAPSGMSRAVQVASAGS